jgi:hypothetical protein
MRLGCVCLLKQGPHILQCVTGHSLTHDLLSHGCHEEAKNLLLKCSPPDVLWVTFLPGLVGDLDVDFFFRCDEGSIKITLELCTSDDGENLRPPKRIVPFVKLDGDHLSQQGCWHNR